MKKASPKFYLFFFPILIVFNLSAQNLVPNPSFENFSSCPTGLSQVNFVDDWYQPSSGTSDFLHACYTGFLGPGVPNNVFGFQEANTGAAYTGMYVHTLNGGTREYIQVQLTEPLVAGECYDVGMFTSPGDVSWLNYGINRLGIHLSTTPPTIEPNGNIYVTPQVYYDDPVVDTIDWTQLLGTYTAVGGEEYLTIGNFFEPGNYDVELFGVPGIDYSYYFIEDVRVELAQGQQNIDATICPGECYEYDGIDYCVEGTYQINNPGGCFSVVNLTITLDELAVAAVLDPDTLGCINNSVILDASGSSSGPGVTYQWSGPNNFDSNQQNPEVIEPGIYTLSVDGASLCPSEVTIEVIEEIIYPEIETEVSGVLDCNSPVITLTGSSTTPNVTYQWTGPGVDTNTPVTTTLESGIYTLVITTSAGCSSTEEVEVLEDLAPPDISTEVQGQLDCSTSSVILTGSSSTPNVTYVWSGPGLNVNTPIALAEQVGTYTFVVLGANGCVSSQSVMVEEVITILDIEASVDGILDCANTSVTLMGSSNAPNITYQWIGPGVFANTPQAQTEQEGEYFFTVTDDNGCTAETSVFVVQNTEAPTIAINTPDTISCDLTSVAIDASASNGLGTLNYEWQNSNGDILGNSAILDVGTSGSYILIITDDENSCTAISTVEVFGNTEQPLAVVESNGVLDCQNDLVTLDGSGSIGDPLSYEWTDTNGDVISMAMLVDVFEQGNYTLLVTNTENGCSSTMSIEVELNAEFPTAVAEVNTILDCTNTEGTLDGSGSSEGTNIEYEWQNPLGDPISNGLEVVVNSPGTYTLVVFDTENGCSSSASVEIMQDIETPIAVAGNDELLTCEETEVSLDGSGSSISIGSLTYQWSNSNGDIISDIVTVTVDMADIYILTVIAENGCSSSDQIEVSLDTNVPVADTGNGGVLDCDVSMLTLGGNGTSTGTNITYEWLDENNEVIAISATTDIDLPGTYTLIVTDISNNCSTSSSIEIPQDIEIPIAESGNNATLNCELIEINLDGSGSSSGNNISYQWLDSNSNLVSEEVTTPVDLPDIYTLIVTNTDNSCSSTSSVMIDQNIEMPTSDAGSDGTLNCNSSEVTLDGSGSSGNNLNFEWMNESGATIGDQSIIEVSQTGVFTLVVTNTESECTSQSTVEVVPDDNLPTAVANPDGILTCANEEVIIDGSGSTSVSGNIGYTWQDDLGNTISITENATITIPGDYTLIVTDTDNGCSISTTVQITEDIETPTADAGQNQTLTCSQTDVTLDGSGSTGNNLAYEWQDGSGNTIAQTVVTTVSSGGTYVLIVTNQTNGCSESSSVEVLPDTNLPAADAGGDETLTCAITQITLDGSNSSTGQNIEYEWQDGAGTIIATTLTTTITSPDTYTLMVLDTDNNCQTQDEVVISQDIESPIPDIAYVSNQEIDCNNSSIALDATGSAPFGVLIFEWTTIDGEIVSGADSPNPELGEAGTYTLTLINTENGCSDSQSIEIVENLESPTAVIDPPQNLTCVIEQIELDATNSSTGNYSYSWSSTPVGGIVSGANTLLPMISAPGIYTLTVINNDNGCETQSEITVLEDTTAPTAVANTEEEFDCITESVTLDGEGSSIGSQYLYQWTGSTTIDNENSLTPTVYQPGNYTLQVTNQENGCTEETTIMVMENDNAPSAAEVVTNDPLCYGELGSISILTVTGGEQPLLYSIDGGQTFSSSSVFTSVTPGAYTILVQDANGCEYEQATMIEAATPIQVLLEPEVILELGESYQINAFSNIDTSQIAQIIWTPTQNLSCTNCLNPTIDTIQNEVEYTLTIINENGCEATDQIMLRVDKTREVYIPNAFSPNDDGQNDVFYIFANNDRIRQVNSFQVFDRWGEQIYRAENFQPNDPTYGWNGRLKEERLNPAVFVYFAEIEFIDGVKLIYKGDVTLMK